MYINCPNGGIKNFDNSFFVQTKHEKATYPEKGKQNIVTLHTFIRNQIHHRKDNGIAKQEELKESIERMRSYF